MGEVSNWVIQQARLKNEIYLLIPARTDTKYFRKLVDELGDHMKIIFITGRLKYNDSGTAPFPTMLIIIKDDIKASQTFEVMTQEEIIDKLSLIF